MPKLSFGLVAIKKKIKENKAAEKLSSDYDKKLSDDGIEISHSSAKSAKKAYFLGVAALLLCVVFLFSMFAIFGKDIKPLNMYYFFREVSLMGQIGEGEREQISYSLPTRNQSFSEFKRGFIVASDREVQVFNKAGYSTLLEQTDYSNPMITSSENTFLVYDLGGRGFTLYNSFEDIYLENREHPISAAAMAENGRFAVVGSSARHNTEAVFYDEEGKKEFVYKRADYTVDCKFSASGRHFALLTLDASGGQYIYTLTILDSTSGDVISTVTRSSSLPYSCHYMDGDKIALIMSDSVVIYNNKCEKVGEYNYPESQLYRTSVDGKSIVLMFTEDKVNMRNTVYVIDTDGDVKKEYEIFGEYSDIAISAKHVYFASDEGVYRLDTGSLKLQFAEAVSSGGKILILDSGRIMLCRPDMSYVIDSWS